MRPGVADSRRDTQTGREGRPRYPARSASSPEVGPSSSPSGPRWRHVAAGAGLGVLGCLVVLILELIGPPVGAQQIAATSESPAGRVRRRLEVDAAGFVSRERLLATLGELTAIGSTSLWRNSASRGEAEALDFVTARLGGLAFLAERGLELERQHFRTYLATQVHQARLVLRVNGEEVEVPAHALQGDRENLGRALRFDSDGTLNDDHPDPVVVEGPTTLLRTASEVTSLPAGSLRGRLALLNYALIDRSVLDRAEADWRIAQVLDAEPAGLVLVTSFSNRRGTSHGTFVGDLSVLVLLPDAPTIPTLYARLEDMGAAGVSDWDDLAAVGQARLTWDADILSPGASSSLIARIPGADPTRAVILGAHIDSPNSPGALDNGSGSVVLLEAARAFDSARSVPPVDLVLCWFGSHERGLYGSSNFLASHPELLDRTVAMLETDCLSRPLDGIEGHLYAETWPYGRFGDPSLTWPNAVAEAAGRRGFEVRPTAVYAVVSDNSGFSAYDVPNANFIFMNPIQMTEVHYDGHLHDPYDTVELAREEGATLESMARVALAAAFDAGRGTASLRVTPQPDGRAVFVASHTEAPHMTPAALTDSSMALAWEGLDVDTVPFGSPVGAADLLDAAMVVALPVHDYPSEGGDVSLYDEGWSAEEVAALETYARDGGLLVIVNTQRRLRFANQALEANEDWPDANALAGRFGITFVAGTVVGSSAARSASHPLMEGVSTLRVVSGNTVRFTMSGGQVLARVGSEPVVAVQSVGARGGQVLVLGDLGLLGSDGGSPANLTFWRNLARYARSREAAASPEAVDPGAPAEGRGAAPFVLAPSVGSGAWRPGEPDGTRWQP